MSYQNELETAINVAFKRKQQNNFRMVSPECCLTCKNSYFDTDDFLACTLLGDGKWSANAVNELNLCDKYERRGN